MCHRYERLELAVLQNVFPFGTLKNVSIRTNLRTVRRLLGRYVYRSFFFSDHCIKQIDSMLPWVCAVIDHKTSKRGKNISDTLAATSLFLPHFDVICDLLLNRHTATWNMFVTDL